MGYSGDNALATNAGLSMEIDGIAIDSTGNMYIADRYNSRIRKVDALTGNITTIAGNGTSADTGDGGPAVDAQVNGISGITVDGADNIYIADNSNLRVRKIDVQTGKISTVAGNGTSGTSGDNGPATSATLQNPDSVSVDANGNVYISDAGNKKIKRVDSITQKITTIAGDGTDTYVGDGLQASTSGIGRPNKVTTDISGNVYFCNNGLVRKIDMGTGIMNRVAGSIQDAPCNGYNGDNEPAINSALNNPQGIAIDKQNNIYISDTGNRRIRKIDAATGNITTIAGIGGWGYSGDGGLATNAAISVSTMAIDNSGNIYIADYSNARIRKIDTSGIITTIAGTGINHLSGDNSSALNATLSYPMGIALDIFGRVFIADTSNSQIRVLAMPRPASGLTVTTEPEAPAKQGKVMLNVSSGIVGSDNKIYYKVDGIVPQQLYVGDTIDLNDWTEFTDANEHEITAANGKYIEAVEVSTTENKVIEWGVSSATNDCYVASAALDISSASFDKNASNQADINVSMALNKYELGSILPNMLEVSSYLPNTLEGNTVTIKKSDLANLTSQSAELRFYDNKGNVKSLDASISVGDAGVNLNMTLIENIISGVSLTDITNEGNTLVKGTDYIVNGSTVTIKRGFLTKVGTGTVNLVFSFGTKKLAVTMSTNETDVKATMTLYESSLVSITNGAYALVKGTDYTVDGNAVTIKKSYLSTLSRGTTALVFNFSEGTPQILNVAISDTTPINYTATFKNYDGSTIGTQTVISGNKIAAPMAPARTGYTFGGWYKEAECQNKWDFANNTVTSAVTLYAKWTINSYTVTFKDYDGKTIGDVQTVNYGENAAAPVAPKRTGYVFAGWDKNYSNVAGDLIVTATYTSGNTYDFPSSSTGNTDESRISVDYLKSRDNTLVINNTTAALAIPASAIDLVNGADNIKVTEKVVTPETNTVQGLFSNLPSSVAKMVGNPISLNAQLLDENGGFIKDIHEFSNNQKVKVTIKLTTAQIAGLGTTKLSMHYYDETSRTWVELGGSFNSTTMEFTFYTQHFTNFAIMNKVSTPAPSTGNTTPTVTSYTVTFKDYNGTVIGTPQAVNYGGSAVAPTAPTRTGYVFAGWDKTFDKVTGDLVVTAKYTSGNTYDFKPITTSNGAETKISVDYLTSRDNTLVINNDGAEISIPAGAIDLADGTSYIKVIEQSDTAADVSKQFGSLPNGLRQVGSPLLLSIQLFDANNNYIKDIKKLSNNEKIKVTMKFTDDELKGITSSELTMYYYDETTKAWAKLEGSFDTNKREMTFYMTSL